MRPRQNRAGGLGASADKYGRRFVDWHWGAADQLHTFEWDDPDFPEHLIEIGRLMHFEIIRPGRRGLFTLSLTRDQGNRSHLAFDGDLPAGKAPMYVLLPKDVRALIKARFWDEADEIMDVREVARIVGGRHARDPWPAMKVAPIGILDKCQYFTHKRGDDDDVPGSAYIHQMGEPEVEGGPMGIRPALSADVRGRLWIIGGSYSVPFPGIAG